MTILLTMILDRFMTVKILNGVNSTMTTDQIINKIKEGMFSKKELVNIADTCARAISEGNHDK